MFLKRGRVHEMHRNREGGGEKKCRLLKGKNLSEASNKSKSTEDHRSHLTPRDPTILTILEKTPPISISKSK